mgnify:CR=1 FL=1
MGHIDCGVADDIFDDGYEAVGDSDSKKSTCKDCINYVKNYVAVAKKYNIK